MGSAGHRARLDPDPTHAFIGCVLNNAFWSFLEALMMIKDLVEIMRKCDGQIDRAAPE
jgi:hypothetical protein